MSKNVLLKVAATLASLLLASIGSAEGTPQLHNGPWPMRNGRNYQPTENELKGLHLKDATPDDAREIDRLYDPLLASSEKVRNRTTASAVPAQSTFGGSGVSCSGACDSRYVKFRGYVMSGSVHGSARIRHRTIPYPIRTAPRSPDPSYNPFADMHQE
jgi:hypothetical protein